ncbi:hypothetical protein phytr_5870 [Candidatus Phycorickettsia trachydisci]|uniref:G-protein coupled receptors family 2 profile 1 domain-containing protein n=1 Tax=Candidatus Phycorickettsia trachydisci TaxID=2115978 RepID=A0A2P1P8C2_9RICK|nr:hypothetical protein [Candidatus Phycorickettsia trachydisci]AVP87530.1 hypothetical protein phytr_5870 [Candidatus Phycorickettsia trachydisci]
MQLSRLSKFIFISLLLCFSNAQASWWSKFVNALTSLVTPVTTPTYYFGDPNHPGVNGRTCVGSACTDNNRVITPNYMKILPPYNRKAGRGPTGREANCLYRYGIADKFEVNQWTCAEDPGSNSTKIKLRNLVCFGGCWAETFQLDGLKGECNFFSTKYLITTKRVCARIASPSSDGFAADPGYMQGTDPVYGTRGQHLDTYGVTQWDDLVADRTGAQYSILRPKICAYDDPWVLDLWTVLDPNILKSSVNPIVYGNFSLSDLVSAIKGFLLGGAINAVFQHIPLDLFDINPVMQPFHGGSAVQSPIATMLLTLLQLWQQCQLGTGFNMAEIIVSMLASSMGANQKTLKVIGKLFEVWAIFLTQETSFWIMILQNNSQVNKYADANYGCINFPLGDYPPNYCPTSASIVTGLLDSICSTDPKGNLYQNCYGLTSAQTNQTTPYTLCSPITCVHSNFDNNFLNNTVRIGYTHPVQACSGNVTKNCVNISLSLTRTSALANNNLVLGSALSLSQVGNITINSGKQYRVLYQVLDSSMTNIVEVSNYYYVDLPDCGSTTNTNGYTPPSSMGSVVQSTQFCQSIWGVDVGEYSDSFNLSVTATTTAPTGPLSTSSSPVSLPYVDVYTGTSSSNKFYIQIDQNTEDYSHVCAYQTFPGTTYPDVKLDCIDRVDIPTPSITSCSTATHISPCATVTWSAKGKSGTPYNATATMTVPQFTSDWSSLPSDPVLYLGGASFTTHVVDTNNLTIPYQPTTSSDNRIVSYSGNTMYDSMWGNYLNSAMPSSSCDQDTCAIYLNGLEYIGGHYVRGGSYLCIDNTKGCQNDTTQCILANNYTALDGSSTWTSISPSDRVSPSATTPSLSSSDYYNYGDNTSVPLGQNVRSKIGLENSSACITVPPATCAVSSDSVTYMATWPAASSAGALATGSCVTNYIPVDSSLMTRYCFLQSTGITTWDTNSTRVSSTFGGCVAGCIYNISLSPSNGSSLNGGGKITVQNNSTSTKSVDGGTIVLSTGSAGTNTITSSGTNTMTINFTLPFTSSQADLYFTSVQFADYIQILVNGTQITTDSSTIAYNGTSYPLWTSASTDVGGWRNYTTLDSNLSNLNAALLNNLKVESNTITINAKTVGGGGFYITMAYNQLCYSQCSSDGAGYATWTQTAVGGISAGTCNSGYIALDSTKMTRYCALSSSAGVLDTVSTVSSTVSGTSSNSSKGTSFGGCVYGTCAAVTSANSSTGYATWSSASYGSSSTGSCMTNYVPVNTGKMTRSCAIVNNAVTLETINANGATTSGNFAGCILGNCAGETAGNATWPSSTINASSTGTCNTGYISVNSSKMSRLCSITNNVAALETINANGATSSGNFAGCQSGCSNDSGGNATWTTVTTGNNSVGTCSSGYTAVSSSYMRRSCSLVNGLAQLDALTNGTSTNFYGCLSTCIALSPTATPGGSNTATVTPNSNGNGGKIVFASTGSTSTSFVAFSSAGTYTFTANFNIPSGISLSQVGIYFTTLKYNDYIRISVNGTQITTDTNTINGYVLWSSGSSDVLTYQDYTTLDPNFTNLNAAILANLKIGQTNTITITVKAISNISAYLYASLGYNTTCYPQCAADTTADVTSGYATWTAAPVGAVATGTCGSGYTPVSSNMARTCNYVSGVSQLETLASDGTSNNFDGCITNCISSTPTVSGNITGTVTPDSTGTAGTIVFMKNPIAAGTGNTGTVSFNIPTGVNLSQVSMYFTVLEYNDYLRISVNGVQVTNDNATINGYYVWSSTAGDVLVAQYYNTLDPNFTNLNAAIISNLKYGANTITITMRGVGSTTGGTTGINLSYNLPCVCGVDSSADVTSGYATWTRATVNSTSTGTCGSGFGAINSSKMSRTCNVVNSIPQLDTITNGTSTNFSGCGCAAVTTASSTSGYATWPVTSIGSLSTGTCASGYSENGSMTRYCQTNGSSAYLDTVSTTATDLYSGTSSNSTHGASFEGCTKDEVYDFHYYVTNNSWTGCALNIYSDTTTYAPYYWVHMNTCWGTGQNGINATSTNDYRITFYVATEAAKQYVSMDYLQFNDYVRIYMSNASTYSGSLNSSTWTQITSDSTTFSGYALYSTSNTDTVWRDYKNAPGGIGSLTTAIQNNLVAGAYNTVRVYLRVVGGGGINWGMKFYSPYNTLPWTGAKATVNTETGP